MELEYFIMGNIVGASIASVIWVLRKKLVPPKSLEVNNKAASASEDGVVRPDGTPLGGR